jgi:hypothetical protein
MQMRAQTVLAVAVFLVLLVLAVVLSMLIAHGGTLPGLGSHSGQSLAAVCGGTIAPC